MSSEITVTQAARLAGVSIPTIRTWFDRGLITGEKRQDKFGPHRVIDKESLLAYISQKQDPARKPGEVLITLPREQYGRATALARTKGMTISKYLGGLGGVAVDQEWAKALAVPETEPETIDLMLTEE